MDFIIFVLVILPSHPFQLEGALLDALENEQHMASTICKCGVVFHV